MFNFSAAESKFKILKCHNKKFVKTSYVNLDCNFDWIPAICLLLFHRNNFKKFSSTKVRKFLILMWVQNLKPEKQWELKIIIFRSKFESVLFNIGKTGAISIIIEEISQKVWDLATFTMINVFDSDRLRFEMPKIDRILVDLSVVRAKFLVFMTWRFRIWDLKSKSSSIKKLL